MRKRLNEMISICAEGKIDKVPSGRVGGSMTALRKAKAMAAAAGADESEGLVSLNARRRSPEAGEFERQLLARVVAQDDAVAALAQLYQIHLAGMALPGKPLGSMLFLGPTGSGKTRAVEAAAEALFGDPNAIVKIDCAEFQHSHEIAKLIGSPPGYLGHRETPPVLTQERLDRFHTPKTRLTLVLFDEIEKASDTLWQLLLGILDKATLTLGDNRRVDFSRCVIVMTSNLGAREMSEVTEGGIGFALPAATSRGIDARLERIGVEAARRKFSPEFMNRLDKVVVFRALGLEALRRILDLEINLVQRRVLDTQRINFSIHCSEGAREFLLEQGFNSRYGARPLKRAIERYVVIPLSNLIATNQIEDGDIIFVSRDQEGEELCFKKQPGSRAPLPNECKAAPSSKLEWSTFLWSS
jgi:ATP-dependent Clp protease ATP-binding subunit ClpA